LYGPGPAVQNCSVAAILASSCVARIFEDFLARDMLRYLSPIYIFYLFTAGLPQISGHKIPILREASKREFKMIRYSLLEMSKTWHSAHRHLGSLNKLLAAMNRSNTTESRAFKRNIALIGQSHKDSSLTDQLSLFERLGPELCPKCDLVIGSTSPSRTIPSQSLVNSEGRELPLHSNAVTTPSSSTDDGIAAVKRITSIERPADRVDQGCVPTYNSGEPSQLSHSAIPNWEDYNAIHTLDIDEERHEPEQEPEAVDPGSNVLTLLAPAGPPPVLEMASRCHLDPSSHRKSVTKQRGHHTSSDHMGHILTTYLHSNSDITAAAVTDRGTQRRRSTNMDGTSRGQRPSVRPAQAGIPQVSHGGLPSAGHSAPSAMSTRSHGEIRRPQQQRQHPQFHNHTDLSGSALENYGSGTRILFEPTETILGRSAAYNSDGGILAMGIGNNSFRGDEMTLDDILESDRSWVMQDWDSGYF
jgi:hypothetical protein